jgi:hypothetical protein
MRNLRRFVAELVAVLAVQVRPRNSTMAMSYGLRREAPRSAELVHSTLSHAVLASRDCRDRIERRCGAQAKCMCSSHARKPSYRLTTSASRVFRCTLCTHRRVLVMGVRAWVRCAAAVAALSASRGRESSRRAALCFSHYKRISFSWLRPFFLQMDSFFFMFLPALTLCSTMAR